MIPRLVNIAARKSPRITNQLLGGSLWRIGGNGALQISALVRIAILARFLDATAFGTMAIFMLMLTAIEMLTVLGLEQALIQYQGNKEDVVQFFPSVFFANLIRGILIAIVLYLTSGLVARYFAIPEDTLVLRASCLVVLIKSVRSPAMIDAYRSMRFRAITATDIVSALVSLVVASILAPIWANVWVLVVAVLVQELTWTMLSYICAPWSPSLKMEWSKLRVLFDFGKWVMLGSLIIYLSLQIDTLAVGRLLGPTELGYYDMAFRISQLPSTQITSVVATVAFPYLSKLVSDIPAFRASYLGITTILLVLNGVFAILLLAFASPFVRIVLGPEWSPIVPALQILAVAGFFRSQVAIGGKVLFALGLPKYDFWVSLIRLIVLCLLLVPFSRFGIEGVSTAVLIASVAMLPPFAWTIYTRLDIGPLDQFRFAWTWFSERRGR